MIHRTELAQSVVSLPSKVEPLQPSATKQPADGLSELKKTFEQVLNRTGEAELNIEQGLKKLSGGAELTNQELIGLQLQVYQASQQAETCSHVVKRLGETVKEVTQIRV